MHYRLPLLAIVTSLLAFVPARAEDVVLSIEKTMTPPEWALLERSLIDMETEACLEFFDKYFDNRGWLKCVERWGGDDGPDDAIENVDDWPLLHAIGAPDVILDLYKKAWEGHLRQYTLARTVDVPFARDGMYYKEFPVMFDWVHNGEGLTVFNLQGLSDPKNILFQNRVRRFAGFYLNEDPQAPNYDPEHRIIRSMFNGSRGPLMRPATGLDWAGDPIEVKNRFHPLHGEETYEQMVEHFKDYNDIVGDHPQNLLATSLGLNAYMLKHEPKYRQWVLEYVDAWAERTRANGNIIPTKIGLDGRIGGPDNKWYGSVYGWAFTVVVPQSGALANRNTHYLGLDGFGNALMLTGNQEYVDVWRSMIDTINSNSKVVNGTRMYPHMYGDQGWYGFSPQPYSSGALEVYYWSMDRKDLHRVQNHGWISYLEGKNPRFPENALRGDLETLRRKVQAMRADQTTPDTRLADDPMGYNPAIIGNLLQLMLGGLNPGHKAAPLHSRLRYFNPDSRRAGIPEDVAALVDSLTDDAVSVTLVNVNQIESRTVIIQTGAYAEHQCMTVQIGDEAPVKINDPTFTVRLQPGAGARLNITLKRFANQPTMVHPWDRGWALR